MKTPEDSRRELDGETRMHIRTAKGVITSVESWFSLAPPKGKRLHWVDGRSAKELAKAWFATGVACVPDPLRALMDSHPDFTALTWEHGEPEAKIRFDRIKGEPRNTDLMIRAKDDGGTIAISIEAKTDEPFGSLVGDAMADALDRHTANPRSKALDRIERLVESLLPAKAPALPNLRSLRYQLLTATAGALAWAERCGSDRAVLVVHEFRSDLASHASQASNHADFDRFIRRIAGSNMQDNLKLGRLAGPISVRGDPLFAQPAKLYFGLIATNCEQKNSRA